MINGKLSSGASTDADLIAFLRSKHKGWPLELTEGVPASSSGGGGGAGSGARTLVKPSYYHGAIKKLDTEELLTADNGAKQAGKFLIRSKSESDNDYIVSVIFKGKVTHHAVSRPGAGDTFTVNGKLETTATDLDGLVEFLRSKHKGWPLELTEGVVNEERSEYSAPAESAAASAPSGSGAEEFTDEEIEVEEEVGIGALFHSRSSLLCLLSFHDCYTAVGRFWVCCDVAWPPSMSLRHLHKEFFSLPLFVLANHLTDSPT